MAQLPAPRAVVFTFFIINSGTKKSRMKKVLTIVISFLFTAGFSQELPDLSKYSKDIGFNSSILLNGLVYSGGSPFDLMLKKQKTANTATRLGLSLNASLSTSSNLGTSYHQWDNYAIELSFGKEKQNQLTKHWIFYYGGDAVPFYRFNQQRYYASNQLQYKYNDSDLGLRLSPFMGIRFQITERLYISTEAALWISYSRKKLHNKNYSNGTTTSESTNEFNNVRFQAIPASGIFLFYRF
jgi:hypothetical protein